MQLISQALRGMGEYELRELGNAIEVSDRIVDACELNKIAY